MILIKQSQKKKKKIQHMFAFALYIIIQEMKYQQTRGHLQLAVRCGEIPSLCKR